MLKNNVIQKCLSIIYYIRPVLLETIVVNKFELLRLRFKYISSLSSEVIFIKYIFSSGQDTLVIGFIFLGLTI